MNEHHGQKLRVNSAIEMIIHVCLDIIGLKSGENKMNG